MAYVMKDVLNIPGELRQISGFVRSVLVVEPNQKSHEKAKAGGYQARTKYHLVIQPNGLEDRKLSFDPEKFPVGKLVELEGAHITVNANVKKLTFDDGGSMEVTSLEKVAKINMSPDGAIAQPAQPKS